MSIVACITGVVIVTISSNSDLNSPATPTVGGYIELGASVIIYALFQVLFKKFTESNQAKEASENKDKTLFVADSINAIEEIANIPNPKKKIFVVCEFLSEIFLTLGFIGLWTFLFYWPGIILLDAIDFETFEQPTGNVYLVLSFLSITDLAFNFFFFACILLTSPVFVSFGSLLSVPISIFFDMVLHEYLLPPMAFIGVGLIVFGFVLINCAQYIITYKVRLLENAVKQREISKFPVSYNERTAQENILLYIAALSVGLKNTIELDQTLIQ